MDLNKLRDYYHNELLNHYDDGTNKLLLDFISHRKISYRMLKNEKFGYAPNTWSIDYLLELYSLETLKGLGIISESDKGKQYPFLRNRFIFPINNSRGDCVGFSGRRLNPEDRAKFLNSKASILFHKSKILYGLDVDAVLKMKYIIVVEGNLDQIRMKYSGFPNTVCSLGTSITEQQIETIITLVGNKVLFLFDGDEAGLKASERANELFTKMKKGKPKIVFIPQGDDPDSFILKDLDNAKERVVALLNKSKKINVKPKKKYVIPENYDEDLSRFDILHIISKYVNLRKRGKEYVGLCPFHNDNNPSFSVNPEKNIWKCFSCGEAGVGAIVFLMKHLKLEFKEAIKLADEL